MERILVGLDGSEASSAALQWSAGIAEACAAELIAVHAFTPHDRELLSPQLFEAIRPSAERQLEDWSSPVHDLVPKLRTEVRNGHPASVLLDSMESEEVALTVVGTRGAGGFAGLHLGSVAHHLAHHATRPVAIVPVAGADRPLETLVIGTDGSKGSNAAVEWTVGLASGLRAHVVAVHAFEPFAEWVPASDPSGWRTYATRELRRWTAPLRDAGLEVEIVIVRDVNPVAALAAEAVRHEAGLVVVGARGLGGFPRLRVGRVPIQLVHHASLAVAMVPAEGGVS